MDTLDRARAAFTEAAIEWAAGGRGHPLVDACRAGAHLWSAYVGAGYPSELAVWSGIGDWLIRVEGIGATQARHLREVDAMATDLIEVMCGESASDVAYVYVLPRRCPTADALTTSTCSPPAGAKIGRPALTPSIALSAVAAKSQEFGGLRGRTRIQGRAMVETSQQPDGLTHRVVLNLLEAFFRRPLLHLLPMVLLIALGVVTAFGSAKEYESVGTLDAATDSLLAELTNRADTTTFGFETPSVVRARNINQLLGSRTFLTQIVAEAGLTTAVEEGLLTPEDIRASISAAAEGDNFVAISATTDDPARSVALAAATVDSFKRWIVDGEVQESATARDILQGQAQAAQEELTLAREQFATFAAQNPAADETLRPLTERVEIERLEDDVERANTTYTTALDRFQTAQAAVDQAASLVESQLRTVDEPILAETPQPRLQKAALTVVLFSVLGVMMSAAFVVLSSMLDRTIRVPEDITAKYGLEVLAVVPRARR